jgi:transcriptional regulator with XRE-family HTH domain
MSTVNVTNEHCNTPSTHVTFDVTVLPMTKVPDEQERWRRFGEWLGNWRKTNTKLNQSAAASKAEMTRQQWGRVEKGTSGSKRETIIKMATAIGCEPALALDQAGFKEPSLIIEAPPLSELEQLEELSQIELLLRLFLDIPRECQLDVLASLSGIHQRRRLSAPIHERSTARILARENIHRILEEIRKRVPIGTRTYHTEAARDAEPVPLEEINKSQKNELPSKATRSRKHRR